MTPTAHARLLQGLNSIARKVYDAVPTNEAWPASKIRTLIPGNPDMNVVKGCLGKMKEDGLVKEVLGRRYLRVEVKGAQAEEPVPQPPKKALGKGQSMSDQLRQLRPALDTTPQAKDSRLAQQFFGTTAKERAERATHRPPVDHDERQGQREFALAQPDEPETHPTFREDFEAKRQSMKPEDAAAVDRAISMTDKEKEKVGHQLIAAGGVMMSGGTQEQAQQMAEAIDKALEEAQPDPAKEPLAYLAALAADLREAAQDHQVRIGNIAHRIEEVALALEGNRESNGDAVEKLRQTKAALAAALAVVGEL